MKTLEQQLTELQSQDRPVLTALTVSGQQAIAHFSSEIVLTKLVEAYIDPSAAFPLTNPVCRFSVEDPRLWDYGPRFSIMCTSPLPFPHQFFFQFFEAVRVKLGINRDPTRYLNWKSSISEWMAFVHARAYLLMSGPEPVVQAASRLLEGQAVEHAVLPPTVQTPSEQYAVVDIGPHWFIVKLPSV